MNIRQIEDKEWIDRQQTVVELPGEGTLTLDKVIELHKWLEEHGIYRDTVYLPVVSGVIG